MAIHERTVKNKRISTGELTSKTGTVYDVNIKYKSAGERRTYSRKGFPTKREARQHEAEMKAKLTNASYSRSEKADSAGIHDRVAGAVRIRQS